MQTTTPPSTHSDTYRAVERLTRTHTVHYEGREYECDALLGQLREAISSSLGSGNGGGRSSMSGSLLDTGALALFEHIDDLARAWMRELTGDHRGDLLGIINRLPAAIQAGHANGVIDDDTRERLDAMFGQWVARIEDFFDPPHQKELTAPCPECGERYYMAETVEQGRVVDTVQVAAVVIPVKRGRAIIAECRCCGSMWATETDLVRLADGMGIEVDFVALRELTAT